MRDETNPHLAFDAKQAFGLFGSLSANPDAVQSAQNPGNGSDRFPHALIALL